MDTSGVTNATQAVKDSSKTLTDDFQEYMVLIGQGPEIKTAGENIQTFVESECKQIDDCAKSMFDNGNGVF